MRRGLIAVLNGCGDYAGSRMIAGTLVVAGGAGRHARLSDAARLDPARPRTRRALSPSFVETGAPDSAFARLIDRLLTAEGILKRSLLGSVQRRFSGDNAVAGRGEILVAA